MCRANEIRAALNGDASIDRHRLRSATGGDHSHGHIVSSYVLSNLLEYGIGSPGPDYSSSVHFFGNQPYNFQVGLGAHGLDRSFQPLDLAANISYRSRFFVS